MPKMPLRFVLSQIFYIQNKRLRPYIAEVGLSAGQPKVLDYLSFNEGSSQKQISKGCGVEPATMSGILNGLVKNGYVEKRSVENNRREFRIFLTTRGREKHKEIREKIEVLENQALRTFSEQEKEEFHKYLERYYAAMTEASDHE